MALLDDVKADVTSALAGTLRPATLWKYSLGDDGMGNEAPVYDTPYACEGLRGSYDAEYASQSGIPRTAARIELLAGTLAVTPINLDKIHIESTWWIIVQVEVDPAGALWVCQCSKTSAEA